MSLGSSDKDQFLAKSGSKFAKQQKKLNCVMEAEKEKTESRTKARTRPLNFSDLVKIKLFFRQNGKNNMP